MTISGHFFSFHQKQAFEADLFDSGDLENASDSSSSTDSSESSSSTQEKNSESKTHRAVPGSFDEATMGLFRKTWHVVMNSPPEGTFLQIGRLPRVVDVFHPNIF